MSHVLPRSFFARDTTRVARGLLGAILETTVRGRRTAGRIVEVEAYLGPHDPAAHGYRGRLTPRNAYLFGPPGIAYVYFVYGMHWCVNAVTEVEGHPSAVLIRALEPLDGIELMRRRRGGVADRALCAGPGRLCQALGITGRMNGLSLSGPRIRMLRGPRARGISVGRRVGITRAADWPLRFWLERSRWVSRGP